VIGVIPKTNRQEELKQASTHTFRCQLRPEGGVEIKAFVRTRVRRLRQIMQRIAVLRKTSAQNAEAWRVEQASQTAEKVDDFVIPSGARNLSSV
jgi:hypothetical protein